MSDPIIESVIEKLRSRSVRGLDKYGVGLDREDLSVVEWLTHAQEELMDAVGYLEKLITVMGGKKPKEPVYGPPPPTLQKQWELERETVGKLLELGQLKQGIKSATVVEAQDTARYILATTIAWDDPTVSSHGTVQMFETREAFDNMVAYCAKHKHTYRYVELGWVRCEVRP